MSSGTKNIIFYDGVCALCNGLVKFVLKRDGAGVFQLASLQSSFAEKFLNARGFDAKDLDTVYVAVAADSSGEKILRKSRAVLFILAELG